MPAFSIVTRNYYMHTVIMNGVISLSGVNSLKYQQFVDDANTIKDCKNDVLFGDAIIKGMEEYFHIQDRDVLLKYLKDTLSASGRYN